MPNLGGAPIAKLSRIYVKGVLASGEIGGTMVSVTNHLFISSTGACMPIWLLGSALSHETL